MSRISGREALFSGLALIRSKPSLLLSLIVVYLLSSAVPQMLAYWLIWPEVVRAIDAASKATLTGVTADQVPEIARMQALMLPYQLLSIPLGVVGWLVIYGAVYRAVLRPAERGFGYARLGRREGALLLTALAAFFLLVVAAMAAGLVILILAMGVRMVAGPESGLTGLTTFALILVATILLGWCGVRLSLAYPMSFAEGRFRLLESWALTRGHGWKIFGVQLATIAILIGVELVLALVVFLIIVAAGLAGAGHAAAIAQAMTAKMAEGAGAWGPQLAAAYLAGMTLLSVIVGGFYIFMIAPLANIYRQLTAEAP